MTSIFGGVTVLPANAAPVYQAQEITPTDGQTVFTTSATYSLGGRMLWVLVNGQKQVYNVDYTETSSTSFTMTSALSSSDNVEILIWTYSNVNADTSLAAGYAAAAAASATAAALTYTNFNNQYLGSKTADPTVNNSGTALVNGNIYFNSTTSIMRVYGSTGWSNVGIATPITINLERFSGTGSQTVYTLTYAPAFQNACEIFISGNSQVAGVDYTITGSDLKTLTFISAPPAGTNNIVVRTAVAYAGGVPNDASVSTIKLQDLSVTTAKLQDTAVTPAKLANSGYELGMRNRIINGDMRIAQRGDTAISNGFIGYGGCDRILGIMYGFTTAAATLKQVFVAGTTSGFWQGVAATTTTGGPGVIGFTSRIEAKNTYDFSGNAVTVSCQLYQDTGSTLTASGFLQKANGTDNFSAAATIGATNTISVPSGVVTKFTFTTVLGSTDGATGLQPIVQFAVGAVTNKNFYIGDLQVEKGATATPFEFRPYGAELALCQRYYWRYGFGGSGFSVIGSGFANSTSQGSLPIQNPVSMRTAPSLGYSSLTHFSTIYNGTTGGAAVTSLGIGHPDSSTNNRFRLDVNLTGTPLVVGNLFAMQGNTTSGWLDLSAEL